MPGMKRTYILNIATVRSGLPAWGEYMPKKFENSDNGKIGLSIRPLHFLGQKRAS